MEKFETHQGINGVHDCVWGPAFVNKTTCTAVGLHTHPFNGPFPGLPGWAGTRKVKPIWILLKQETVSGSGISWAICKSAYRSRQITMPAPHHSVFYRPDALPAAQPAVSKHWRHNTKYIVQYCTQYSHNQVSNESSVKENAGLHPKSCVRRRVQDVDSFCAFVFR